MLSIRPTAYEFGPYRVDPTDRSLLRRGEVIALPPKAIEVLVALIRRPGAIVGKPELMEAVWPQSFADEANLNQMIFLLRRAFGSDDGNEYIATVPRRGYRFTAGVRTVETPRRIQSLAVLPLANQSGDAAQEYFADGVTEGLIAQLAKIRSLRVVARNSALRYRDSRDAVAQVARDLRVQAVLEGSVTRSGDRFRITARLIHAATEQPLWTETFDGHMGGILGVEAQVAREVLAAIRAEVSQEEKDRLCASRAVRPEAYSLYLKGRYYARILTEHGQRRAIRYFRESIRTDPQHASAHAGIAVCCIELARFFAIEPKTAFGEAETAAVTAVTLDDSLAEGHAALSLLRLFKDRDWEAANAGSQRAIALAPGDAYAYRTRGVCLRYAGRSVEAAALHRHAEFLDPFSVVAIQEAGWALYYGRRFDAAVEQFRKAVEFEPAWDHPYLGLGLTLVQQQRHDEAIAALRLAAERGPGNAFTEAALAYALGRAGRRSEAQRAAEQLAEKHASVPHCVRSIACLGQNDPEQAVASLEHALCDHEPRLVALKVDPMFDSLRGEARFRAIVRQIGLTP
jgi:TolB-like protein/Flp pilus assembly protein TadD